MILLHLAPGLLTLYCVYRTDGGFIASFFANDAGDLSALLGGAAFAMMGLLAAVLALLFAFADAPIYREMKRRGSIGVFLITFAICLMLLAVTFVLSLLQFSEVTAAAVRPWLAATIVTNVWQTLLLTLAMLNYLRHAGHGTSTVS